MDFSSVTTLGGYKSHLTLDGVRTLCGREVSNGCSEIDMCKRCANKRDKFNEGRSRTEYAARVAETQDDVMSWSDTACRHGNGSECVPCEEEDAIAAAKGPMAQIAPVLTDWELEILAAAAADELPVIDPSSNIGCYPDPDGENTEQAAPVVEPERVLTSVVHYGESRPLCGAKLGDNDTCVTSVNETTCVTCWDDCVRSVDVVPEYRIEITRHVVSYYAPADHSACEHKTAPLSEHDTLCTMLEPLHGGGCDCPLSDAECDNVGGRSLDGDYREITPAETETITWDREYDPDTYEGESPEARAEWVRYHVDPLGYFEPSSYPIGDSAMEWEWLSASDRNEITDPETVTELTVRLTGDWTDADRAMAFRNVTGSM